MQIVKCDQCGGSHIGLGEVSIDVSMNKADVGDACNQTHTDTTSYFFCSEKCFKEYILDKKSFDFERYTRKAG